MESGVVNLMYWPWTTNLLLKIPVYTLRNTVIYLKLVSTIFYQIFIFSQNDSPLKTTNFIFLFRLKISSRSQVIQIFVGFSFPYHTFQIQKDKWEWNNL